MFLFEEGDKWQTMTRQTLCCGHFSIRSLSPCTHPLHPCPRSLCLFIAILHYFILLILICEAKTMAIQQNNTSTNINVKWLLIRQNVWVFYVGNISRTLDECCIAQPSTWYLYLHSWNLMFFSCLLGPGNVTGSVCLIKARRKWFDSRLKFRRRVNGAAWKKRQI